MVWGVEMCDHAGRSAADWAGACVLACYNGDGPQGDGIHLLGPLAKKVVRISPPLVITADEVRAEHGTDVPLAVDWPAWTLRAGPSSVG